MEHLLPERRSVDRFLAGTEGTLAVVRSATVRLVEETPRHLVVLGYSSMIEAADAVPALLAACGRPTDAVRGVNRGGLVACEGLDARIVDLVRARSGVVPALPRGAGWLFVEVSDADLLTRGAQRDGPSRRVAGPRLRRHSGCVLLLAGVGG